MPTTTITSLGEILGDSSVIVFANGSIIGAWDRKQTVTMWDTMQKRATGTGSSWGWTEYEVCAVLDPDEEDAGVDWDLAWAMDKAADWYEENGQDY